MKYVATNYSNLGQTCDSKEQAERAALGMDYQSDAYVGYSTAFNCEPLHHAEVTEIEDRVIPVAEYLKSEKKKEKAEKRFEEAVKKLRRRMLGKYKDLKVAYINTNTPYSYGDKIRLTIIVNGKKRKIVATVCGVTVEKDGEIRPDLRCYAYPRDAQIVSIEVLKRFDYTNVNREVICKNCKHFKPNEPHGYCLGYCEKNYMDVYYSKENEPCYENDPNKYKNVKD